MLQSLQERRRPKIFLLGNGKIDLDRIDLGHLGQDRGGSAGPDQIADLSLGHARDPIERRRDCAIVQIDLCRLNICLLSRDRRDGRLGVLVGSVVFLLADHLRPIKLCLTVKGDFSELRVGNSLRVIGLRLGESCLKRPFVDCEEDLSLFDERTLLVILRHEIAGHLGSDVRVLIAVKQSHPVPHYVNILLNDGGDCHFRRRRSRGGSLLLA